MRPPPAMAIWELAPSSAAWATPLPRWRLSTKMHAMRQFAGGGGSLRYASMFQIQGVRDAVLAPALRDSLLIKDQRRMGSTASDQPLLECSWIADAALVLDVVRGAPTSSINAVVALDKIYEGVPRLSVELTDCVLGVGHRLIFCIARNMLGTHQSRGRGGHGGHLSAPTERSRHTLRLARTLTNELRELGAGTRLPGWIRTKHVQPATS